MAEANFASAFSSMASPYMQARAVDIHDISHRSFWFSWETGRSLPWLSPPF